MLYSIILLNFVLFLHYYNFSKNYIWIIEGNTVHKGHIFSKKELFLLFIPPVSLLFGFFAHNIIKNKEQELFQQFKKK